MFRRKTEHRNITGQYEASNYYDFYLLSLIRQPKYTTYTPSPPTTMARVVGGGLNSPEKQEKQPESTIESLTAIERK